MYIYLNEDKSVKLINANELNLENKITLNNKDFKEFFKLYKNQSKQFKLYYENNEFILKQSFDYAIESLRKIRDKKLQETDYLFLSDTTKLTETTEKTALKIERQKLRDITNDLTSVDQVLSKIKELK